MTSSLMCVCVADITVVCPKPGSTSRPSDPGSDQTQVLFSNCCSGNYFTMESNHTYNGGSINKSYQILLDILVTKPLKLLHWLYVIHITIAICLCLSVCFSASPSAIYNSVIFHLSICQLQRPMLVCHQQGSSVCFSVSYNCNIEEAIKWAKVSPIVLVGNNKLL